MMNVRFPTMRWSCLWLIMGMGSCAHRTMDPIQPPQNHPETELRARMANTEKPAVLFVGNSYSFALPREFSAAAMAHGRRVRTGHSTHGGWTLAKHAKHEPTLQKIRNGRWDVVVFQEHSLIPAQSRAARERQMHAPLRLLVDEARRAGALSVLYQTWGRRDGNPNLRGDDFHAMTARLREGYHAASEHVGRVVVAPVGDVWERACLDGRKEELYEPDGSHPAAAGEKLIASVFANVLLGNGVAMK